MKKGKLFQVALMMLPMMLLTLWGFGQNVNLQGTVTDDTGSPIPGVSVTVQETTIGTVTDFDGKFDLEVPLGSKVLVFSFVGMQTREVEIGSQTTFNIAMEPDVVGLDEVVVVGYGTVKKSDISGSVASVDTEEMMKKAPTNIVQGLQGAAAGVMVMAQDGAPDANAAIRIRGVATINGSADPLYVVDGVQVGTNADFIAPSDIASIEVLKDASATAIYGAAGANGVIMITTKHGKSGISHISFSADFGVQTLASTLDVGDAEQYAKNIRTARANDGAVLQNEVFLSQYDGQRKTIDWQDEMSRVALKQQYTLSATNGTEKTQSNFSLTYLDNDGIVINSNYKRLTARANVVTKVGEFLELGGDVNFVHTESQGSNGGLGNNGNLSSIRDWAFLCPTMDYVDPTTGDYVSPNVINANGTYGSPLQGNVGAYDGMLGNNVYAEQMENTGVSKNNRVIASAYLDIKPFKGLSIKSLGSYNFSAGNYYNFWGNKKRYMPDGVTEVELYNYDARYQMNINNSNYNTLALETYVTYNWKNEIHNLTLMGGNTVSKSFGNWSSANAVDFPAENIRDISLTSDPSTRTGSGAYNLEVRGLSFFGRASYSLKDRYILTGTVRRDGSSNFGAGNRYGTFPSAAAAWRISEESFMQAAPAISNLKLRVGWGQTGNSGGPTDRATAALTSSTIQYFFYPQGGPAGLGTSRQLTNGYVRTLVDTNLKWETNEQTNIGVDLGLLNSNLNITADYFIRTSKDLLLMQAIRPSAGYTEVYTNYGEIQNKGFEMSIDYRKQINNDWTISATVTGSTIKNEIVEIGSDLFFENTDATGDGSNVGAIGAPSGTHWNGHSIMREGYAVGSFYGYEVAGIFQSQAEVDQYNAAAVDAGHAQYQNAGTGAGDFIYKDLNEDGFIDENDMTILGDGFPAANYGLNLNVEYKNFDLSVNTYGVIGAKIYSYSAMTLSNMFPSDNGTTPNLLTEASQNAWTPENQSTSMSKLTFLDLNYNMRGSDAWIKDGDYFKISTIQLGYTFDKNVLAPLHLGSARLYAAVQNVLTISGYNKYGDPEVGQGSVLYTGLDSGRYPMPRTYSFGLNIQF
ncbi:TonB-dependent receptor [uncultured Draconibacterium sp.]|uniref:SusC/RagA family TonB-linked outer membrane protein n=1 Tax=uncultured Draconibacterium sp. TaxID=1573823 RepID=UPI0029C61F82|nr:TonB-dependent receptor [uncultured Draconibacterium sp.]